MKIWIWPSCKRRRPWRWRQTILLYTRRRKMYFQWIIFKIRKECFSEMRKCRNRWVVLFARTTHRKPKAIFQNHHKVKEKVSTPAGKSWTSFCRPSTSSKTWWISKPIHLAAEPILSISQLRGFLCTILSSFQPQLEVLLWASIKALRIYTADRSRLWPIRTKFTKKFKIKRITTANLLEPGTFKANCMLAFPKTAVNWKSRILRPVILQVPYNTSKQQHF